MNNIQMIVDNAASRATITGSVVAPGMSLTAMLNDVKSHVCRSVGTAFEIVMTWPSDEVIGGVHLPRCNVSSLGTIELLGYSAAVGGAQVLSVAPTLCCPAPARKLRFPWTAITAAVAYAYGGGSHGFVWFANTTIRRLVIRLSDAGSPQGYNEVSRIFVGEKVTLEGGASYNPSITPASTGSQSRSHAGDRRSVKGTKHFKLAVVLADMTETDRKFIWNMLVANGLDEPIIVSLYPGDPSAERERDHQMLGVLVQTPAMRRPNFAQHATSLEWESM